MPSSGLCQKVRDPDTGIRSKDWGITIVCNVYKLLVYIFKVKRFLDVNILCDILLLILIKRITRLICSFQLFFLSFQLFGLAWYRNIPYYCSRNGMDSKFWIFFYNKWTLGSRPGSRRYIQVCLTFHLRSPMSSASPPPILPQTPNPVSNLKEQ
jgi:hypothetical protein